MKKTIKYIDDIKKTLVEQRKNIQSTFYVREMGVFGSFIRNEQTKKSDIDILVEFEKGHKDFFNYMRLKDYLEKSLGRRVDLVMKEAIKPGLKDKIFKEVVYV